jgi:hypothetical protein
VDPGSLLTMASMRISLSLLKSLRGTNSQIFKDMCESLMALFEVRHTAHSGAINHRVSGALTSSPLLRGNHDSCRRSRS